MLSQQRSAKKPPIQVIGQYRSTSQYAFITSRHPGARGFSLIEMIVALVVSAILAIGLIGFIDDSVDGFTTTANRNQLASAGRVAIDRLAFELHNALPNSIRVTSANAAGEQCIEFIPVRASTSYLTPSFRGGGSISFEVVDFDPTQHGTSGGFAVIYPNRQNQLYDGDNGPSGNWPDFPSNRPIQEIDSIADSALPDQSTVTLVKSHRFRRRSPFQRFFLVDEPVSYCIVGDKLYRYTNYGFYTNQVDREEEAGVCEVASNDRCLPNYAAAPNKMLMTDSINNTGLTAFDVIEQSLRRNSLVSIEMNFERDTDSIALNHEVMTRSVP